MRIPGFLVRNFRLKLLSVILATVTWGGVVYASNPPQTVVVNIHVPQDRTSVPAKYVLVHTIADIPVVLSGTRDHLSAFDSRSLIVTADYSKVNKAGDVSVPVHLVDSDPNVEITSAPTSVVGTFDTLGSRTVAVSLVINPPPPFGYVVASQTVTPSQVTLIGPTRELALAQPRVTLNLSTQKTNLVDTDVPLQIYGPGNVNVSDVGLVQPTVQVSITLQATETSRSTAVVPAFTGQVASGHELVGIVVSPPTVVISGPRDLLNGLDEISTQQISLNGLTGTTTVTVTLVPPAGVTAVPQSVTVTLTIIALPTPSATASPAPPAPPSPTPTP